MVKWRDDFSKPWIKIDEDLFLKQKKNIDKKEEEEREGISQ